MLNSPKLPAMLSRKHASLKYNPKMKEWVVKDLEVCKWIVLFQAMCGLGMSLVNG